MKDFVEVGSKYAKHFVHESRALPSKVTPIRMPVRILGIDPGVRCGFASVNARNWSDKGLVIDHFAYADVSNSDEFPGHIEKIRFIGKAMREIMRMLDPMAMAIESVVVAKRPNASTLLQARMFQHLIDISAGLYHVGFSEINPSTSRATVLQKGDRVKNKTKKNVVLRLSECFDLDFSGLAEDQTNQTYMEQAMADAVTVALAFIEKVRDKR